MEAIANWYENTLGSWMPKQIFVFLVSMIPLIELRGGLVIARLLDMPFWQANLFCIIGNIIPIPFILLFIRKIFEFMKKHNILKKMVLKLEARAEKKNKAAERGEFAFLLTFVGIPLPGTGAWTGSLIASLMQYNIKKASIAIFLGILMAAAIIDILAYAIPGLIL
ncbi:MAG: small multi-drug export protein [Lachnospiraceae bacterium]|nr:small multi-drug export protein [Lachnospiraceae bacterium]